MVDLDNFILFYLFTYFLASEKTLQYLSLVIVDDKV